MDNLGQHGIITRANSPAKNAARLRGDHKTVVLGCHGCLQKKARENVRPFGTIITSCLGKMLDKAKDQGKPRRYLRNINVRWLGFDLSDVQEMRIAEDEVERYSIRKGDLVVCEGGEPGRCAIWCDEETVCFQKALHRVRFNEASDPRFYMYYLWMLAKSGMLAAYYTGTGIKHLTGESLKKLPVPVPPLAEQKRIVARIEELFSELDNGVETLKKTKQQLAVYRQSVLKAAFEGTWINSKPERHAKISDLADVGTGATPLTSNPSYYGGGIAWVTSSKINDGHISVPSEYITEKAISETNCKVYPPHTLLVAMYGEGKTRGKCAELMIHAATNQALAAIELYDNTERFRNFVKWFLVFNYQLIRRKASGGVQPNLNLRSIKNITIPIFNDEDQVRIVSEIESRLSVCDSIEKTVDAALQQAESLRQSILKKAFEGKL